MKYYWDIGGFDVSHHCCERPDRIRACSKVKRSVITQ
jgi:hypothetical protein